MAEQLEELKSRLAELSTAMDELLSRQPPPKAEPPDGGGPEPPEDGGPDTPSTAAS